MMMTMMKKIAESTMDDEWDGRGVQGLALISL